MPSVSVIVPVYKVEEYLSRCVDSILKQTFSDFELILVDDGSPDKCGEICDSYLKIDSRVRVIHQVNAGVSSARNNGVKAALGEYVTFVDSDDWVDKNYLKVLYELCIRNDAQMSLCRYLNTDNSASACSHSVTYECDTMTGIEAINHFGMLRDGRFYGPVVKLIKKEIVLANPFPLDRKIGEDTACVYKWMYAAKTIVATEETYYYYFYREGSATHSGVSRTKLDAAKTYEEMLTFFSEKGIDKLFDHILNYLTVYLLKYYEICVAEGNKEDADAFRTEYIKLVDKWLIIKDGIYDVRKREDIIPFVDESRRSDCIKECINTMAIHLNYKDYGVILNLKPRLRRVLMKYHPPIEENVYAYTSVFPKMIDIYWRIKGIAHHFSNS